jgi:hypothetical protein
MTGLRNGVTSSWRTRSVASSVVSPPTSIVPIRTPSAISSERELSQA